MWPGSSAMLSARYTAPLSIWVGKTPSFETAWLEPAVMTNEEAAPSFMECMQAVHIVTKVTEYTAGRVVESDFNVTDYMK